MHLLLFLSPDWLLSRDYLSYKFTRFFIYFLFLSDEENDYTIRIGSTPTFLYFDWYVIAFHRVSFL